MSSLEDYEVDRSEVYRRIFKGLQLTDTNRANGLVVVRACSVMVSLPRTSRRDCSLHRTIPGGHSGGATPVPIPNTAVKPAGANDTRKGKVGNCLDLLQSPEPIGSGDCFF